nr:hypothetical protein [Tanacetum cinerariifolium]
MTPVGHDMCFEVLKFIEDSDMYVVVFSYNYASSDVKPRQEGPFMEAFQALEADDEVNPERVDTCKP